jgi:hypothetical protein
MNGFDKLRRLQEKWYVWRSLRSDGDYEWVVRIPDRHARHWTNMHSSFLPWQQVACASWSSAMGFIERQERWSRERTD